jgi:hypothetical protein
MAPVSNLQGSRQFGMVVRISEMRLLTAMAKEETFAEAPSRVPQLRGGSGNRSIRSVPSHHSDQNDSCKELLRMTAPRGNQIGVSIIRKTSSTKAKR